MISKGELGLCHSKKSLWRGLARECFYEPLWDDAPEAALRFCIDCERVGRQRQMPTGMSRTPDISAALHDAARAPSSSRVGSALVINEARACSREGAGRERRNPLSKHHCFRGECGRLRWCRFRSRTGRAASAPTDRRLAPARAG